MGLLFSLFPFSFSTTSFSKISCLMKLNNVVFNMQNILNTVYINFIILAVQSLRLGGTVLLQLIPISFPVSGETLFSLLRYQLIRFFFIYVWKENRCVSSLETENGQGDSLGGSAPETSLFCLSFLRLCTLAVLWFFPSQPSSGRCMERFFWG